MRASATGDPRIQALFGLDSLRDQGARPVVRLPRRGLSSAAIIAIAIGLAVFLFLLLNARRERHVEPALAVRTSNEPAADWTPPPLYLPTIGQPPQPPAWSEPVAIREVPWSRHHDTPVGPARGSLRMVRPLPMPLPPVMERIPSDPAFAHRSAGGSALVIDTNAATGANAVGQSRFAGSTGQPSAQPGTRMRASPLANPSMTVPQGYLVNAVLETGFDSTKGGYARALVSHDVRGFDGQQVLIPRGSRLIGESDSAVARGQNRAIITWTRLIRPDGMTIALDSPAVDLAGRNGIAASANTHFFARLGDALLQSTFAIGQALAGRAVNGPVMLVGGNGVSGGTQVPGERGNYVPTLKVAPGTSISVFVAHDLDFSVAGSGR